MQWSDFFRKYYSGISGGRTNRHITHTPVREALHFMEKEGLLEILPRVGYRVREIELQEFEDTCEIRKALELLAVQFAIQRINPKILDELKDNLARSEAKTKEEDWKSFFDLDAEFHELLAKASGNSRLQNMIQALRADMVRYRIKSLHQEETVRIAFEGHQRIIKAFAEGNLAAAETAILEHLEQSQKYILLHAFSKEDSA